MLLLDFFEDVYRPRRLLGKSANTSRLYRLSIRSFGRTLERCARLRDLTDDNLLRHMQRVVDAGRANATANKDRSQLLAMWRYAMQRKLLTDWPDVPQYIEPERVPMAWLADELDQLFAAIANQEGAYIGVPKSLWWRTLVMICLDTGERIGAVSQAQWDWLQGEWIHFPAESRKGGRRDRTYRLSEETIVLLSQVQATSHDCGRILPWPYCDGYLWTLFKKILIAADLPHGRKDKFHRLRKTTGSVAYAAGLDAQDVLDHSSKHVTKKYLDPRFMREQQACDALAHFLAHPKRSHQRKAQ